MVGYRTNDACLNRVRQFYSQRLFVVPAQRVEVWSFPTSASLTGIRTSQNIPLSHIIDICLLIPKDARVTTCYENPCYQNIQVTTCRQNFSDMPLNTLDQQFFQLQLNTSNLNLLFEATDEFEDVLTTLRNTTTRRLNPYTDLTSFLITLKCERNSNGALTGNRPPPPILCTIQDTFRLFSPAAGGRCIYNTNYSFDEVIGPLSA
ncbi:MAG: hypothetical protein EZS28_017047 [Streblomastix strix]|uniref:Uncharacterized protein n=1 Tax=Streblomastix strix TaxID=222440 RepID=A0A5J4VXH8_9EUKA|nr:MAG: hypothetical protein EZS28_017047 [Streblomastix strix]